MKKFVLAILLTLSFTSLAFAANGGVAFVDLQKALNLSKAGMEAKKQIGEQVKKYESEVTQRQEELKKLKQELEKQAVLLSDDAKAQKERDYQQKVKEFQRYTKDIQEEVQQKDQDFTKQIISEIFEIVKELGKKGEYSVILEKTESSLLYGSDNVDLTDQIIELHNSASK